MTTKNKGVITRLGVEVAADEPNKQEMLIKVSLEAGCTEGCKLLGGYSVYDLADVYWHGTTTLRAEARIESKAKTTSFDHYDRIVAFVRAMHAAEAALDA